MRKILIPLLILMMVAFVFYERFGNKEAAFRNNSSRLRAQACLKNPNIDIAVIGPEEESDRVKIGIEMAVLEANNNRNPDGSTGPKILLSHDSMTTKKIQCHYYTYNSKEEALELSRRISRQYEFSAVIGHYVSDISYPAALNYHQAGLMYICPFSTSTRITSHRWPNIIRMLPSVKAIMSAILKNISFLFDQKQDTIRLAVFNTATIYGEDALTALHNYIAESKRLVNILNTADKMINEGRLSRDIFVHDWLSIDWQSEEPTLEEIDASDKLFITKQLIDFGFGSPGIRSEDMDIDHLQKVGHTLFSENLTVASAIEYLRKLTSNIEVVHSVQYRRGTVDFGPYLRLLSQSHADIILILDYMNETSAELLSELRESGNTKPIIGDDGLEFPDLIKQILGDMAGDIYIVSSYDDKEHGTYLTHKFEELSKYFTDQQIKNFHPHYLTYQGYRSASLFAQAVAESHSSDPSILASRIKYSGDQGWLGQSGNQLQFDSHGDLMYPEFLLKKYTNGKFELIK
ncbi:MAG: ABC transporter substrate-binding protein [Candidatus Latescibacteria bacterium]|nr:ABC transporter substrate-binding protein [Candidatus Latescibacterota bacterium]